MISSTDTNPKTALGAAKPSPALVPPVAVLEMARAFEDGARKYGAYNYRENPVSLMTYINAAYRHLMSFQDREEVAEDSGVHHLGHAMACMAIVLDTLSLGMAVDDRPAPGAASEFIKENTKKING